MPLYTIKPTSTKGQVLFVSTDHVGPRPIISLQMPEQRARQLAAAMDYAEEMSKLVDDPLITIRAKKIMDMPIEMS